MAKTIEEKLKENRGIGLNFIEAHYLRYMLSDVDKDRTAESKHRMYVVYNDLDNGKRYCDNLFNLYQTCIKLQGEEKVHLS